MFPRRAPQTAGHRCDFGLGPTGPYRALPIGPYIIGPYIGPYLGPYLAALFSFFLTDVPSFFVFCGP